jgi:hypothetical protein
MSLQQMITRSVALWPILNDLGRDIQSILQQAVDFAKNVFPELARVPREDISFSVMVKGEERKTCDVRIGPMAWSSVVATLPQYHYIEIHVCSHLNVPEGSYFTPPPRYSYDSKDPRSRSAPSSPHPEDSDRHERRKSWVGKLLG